MKRILEPEVMDTREEAGGWEGSRMTPWITAPVNRGICGARG